MLKTTEIIKLSKFGESLYKNDIISVFKKTNMFEPFEIDWLNEQICGKEEYDALRYNNNEYHWCIYLNTEKGKTIVGASCYGPILKERPGRFDLYWIAVDPDFQGKGIGKILLEQTEYYAKQDGATHMYIETGSFNESGNRLYKAADYKLMGVLEQYYNDTQHKHIWGKKL